MALKPLELSTKENKKQTRAKMMKNGKKSMKKMHLKLHWL